MMVMNIQGVSEVYKSASAPLPAPSTDVVIPPRAHIAVRTSLELSSLMISTVVTTLILLAFVMSSDRFAHWFILPVFCSGVLIGTDAVRWFRGSVHVFDPTGILGLIGYHSFFLAPLLHVNWDYWLPWVAGPQEWRLWLGFMACFNAVGLLLYLLARNVVWRRCARGTRRYEWRLNRQKFALVLIVALMVTGALQVWVYARFGGVQGYIDAFSRQEFKGMGWIFAISESFPILVIFGYVAFARGHSGPRTRWWTIGAILLVFVALQLIFGGLRGSRSNTVWAVFWAVGLIHIFIRQITRKQVLLGVTCLTMFMYAYGFYKSYGDEAIEALRSSERRAEMSRQSERSMQTVILGDFGRAALQAVILRNVWPSNVTFEYHYAWGETYLGALALPIPATFLPNPPQTKAEVGTLALYGPESLETRSQLSSRVYGLAGEAMLNFGPLAVLPAYVVLGLVIGAARKWVNGLSVRDSRSFMLPFVVVLCIYALLYDSDNVMYFIIKNGTMPFVVIALCSKRVPLNG